MFVFKYSYKNTVATNRAKGVAVFEGSHIRYNIAQLILSAICGRLHFIARGKIIPFKSEQYSEFFFNECGWSDVLEYSRMCTRRLIMALQFNSQKAVQKLFHKFHIIFSNSLMGFKVICHLEKEHLKGLANVQEIFS